MSNTDYLLDLDDQIPLLPFDDDAFDPKAPQKAPQPRAPGAPAVLGDSFAYIGQALDVGEFAAYVATYPFGKIPPEYVVLHHTANPDASYAPLSKDPKTKWDRSEAGATTAQIKIKRKAQLDAIMRFYRDTNQWDRGFHLAIDERWIWLFTPMYDVGIHAKSGNSYHDRAGDLHYSVGIEVVGYYEKVRWPEAVARNVGMALAILRRRLGTFGLDYRPGPRNTPSAHLASLSSHRDYNKPECPGKAITEEFYVAVAQAAWRELTAKPTAPAAPAKPAAPPAPHPLDTHYRVKQGVTAGATIRADAHTNAAVLGRLKAGDDWYGEAIPGQLVTVPGFGSSNQWIRAADQRCVAAVLLEKVKSEA